MLAALACDEIVMGPEASLGPITPEGEPVDPGIREPVRYLAIRKGRDPDLLLGMLDRNADLRAVRTADKQLHYVMAENLPEFARTHQVIEDEPAWEGGQRGRPDGQAGARGGLRQADRRQPAEVANAYQLAGQSATNDPTLGPGAQAGLDPDRRAARHGQEVVPDPPDRAGPAGAGQPRASSRSTARAGSTRPPTASPTRSPRSRT